MHEHSHADTGPLIRRLFALAWRYRAGCLKVLALQLLLLTLGLVGLSFMGLGIDYIRHALTSPIEGAATAALAKPPRWPFGLAPPTSWPPMRVLLLLAGGILGFALLRTALNFLYTVELSRLVEAGIVVELRAKVYDKLQRLSFRFLDANATGSLINRVTGDVQAVRMFVDGVLMQAVIMALSLAVYSLYMLRIHAGLTLACLAPMPLIWYSTSRFSRQVQPAYLEGRERFDRLLLTLTENIRGAHVVKGFAAQPREEEKFQRANQRVREQKQWIFRRIALFNPLTGFVTHVGLGILLAYGGWLVIRHEQAPDAASAAAAGLSIGQLLVFTGLLQQFAGQVANIANIANTMQQSLTGARRVFEVLDAPVEIASPPTPKPLPGGPAHIVFEHVGFHYEPGRPVIEDFSLQVPAGACVALLGATGSGKSTLLSLLPRFYDPTRGRVTFNGMDLRDIAVDELRRRIGMVFQESFLFSNTVAANIAFGHPDASHEQIERAARLAAAHEFILAMPEGYQTVLREGGANLSGGQRQRLALARALLLDPPLLLLDDPTAAVDPETEHDILDALDGAMRGRTTFLVAHRLSALRRADMIVVMKEGRIIQTGRHEELIDQPGFYRLVASLQNEPQKAGELLVQGRGEPW